MSLQLSLLTLATVVVWVVELQTKVREDFTITEKEGSVLNVKALIVTLNEEKAFSVIVKLHVIFAMDRLQL